MDLSATRSLHPPLNLPFRHNFLCGQVYPPVIDGNEIHRSANYELRDDDVILVTYPKSGTTWVQMILKCLYEKNGVSKDARISSRNQLSQALPWIELMSREEFDGMTSPRVMTTHEAYKDVVYDPDTQAKYIYLSRNPKDVAVSFYYHIQGYRAYEFKENMDNFLEYFKAGKVPYGSWFTHNLDYYENMRDLEIFSLDYETLHHSFEKTVMKLNKFLDLKPLSNEDLETIKSKCSFEAMRTNSNTNQSRFNHRRKADSEQFMRRGKVGDWAEHLSEKESQAFDAITDSYFRNTSRKFLYKV